MDRAAVSVLDVCSTGSDFRRVTEVFVGAAIDAAGRSRIVATEPSGRRACEAVRLDGGS